MEILVIILLFGVCALYVFGIQAPKEEAFKKSTLDMHLIDTSKLKVDHRVETNRDYLSMRQHQETGYKYNPATATFTSATVGGITTGGWDYKQAHYSAVGGAFTDRYELCYTSLKSDGKKERHIITKIELKPEDALTARANGFLRQFMNENTMVLKKKIVAENKEIATDILRRTGDVYAAATVLAGDHTKTLLTKDEMQQVVDFLCGKIN